MPKKLGPDLGPACYKRNCRRLHRNGCVHAPGQRLAGENTQREMRLTLRFFSGKFEPVESRRPRAILAACQSDIVWLLPGLHHKMIGGNTGAREHTERVLQKQTAK